ncbi:hypothetical protein [Rubritalea tangerina]|uniref:hypothetical protein n=1 Tax=Rubritalea tangerina TaxID=430798 RepID=UPI0036155CC9
MPLKPKLAITTSQTQPITTLSRFLPTTLTLGSVKLNFIPTQNTLNRSSTPYKSYSISALPRLP